MDVGTSIENSIEQLNGKTVAFMVAAGFNETEFSELQRRLAKSGATLLTIAAESGVVNGWNAEANAWGHYHPVGKNLADTLAAELDVLVVPGGARAAAKLAQNLHAKRILNHAIDGMVPVAIFGEASELLTAFGSHPGLNVQAVADLTQEGWIDSTIAHLASDFESMEETRAAA